MSLLPHRVVLVGPRDAIAARARQLELPADQVVLVSSAADTARLRGLDPRRVTVQVHEHAGALADWHLVYPEVSFLQMAVARVTEGAVPAVRSRWDA